MYKDGYFLVGVCLVLEVLGDFDLLEEEFCEFDFRFLIFIFDFEILILKMRLNIF